MRTFFTIVLLVLGTGAFAQNNTTGGCGTRTPQSEVDKIYDFVQHNPGAYAKTTAGTIDSIPLSIHIVGTDAGTGYYTLNNLFPVLCELNNHFAPVNFHFYIKWPIDYINSSRYYEHDFWDGSTMMQQNNVASAANVYFVQDPAGNCGYYTYGADAVAIGKNCAGARSTTLTHELGHYFSLPHTFYGWENGNTPSNPEAVRRSGPGTNCNSSGDGFCDTYADYYSNRWSCPGPVNKKDNYGDYYHLDSSMYMSYSSDVCQSQFSNQQMAAMQYNLHSSRQSYPGAITPKAYPLNYAQVIYPADTLFANVKKALWRRVAGADYYYVRVSLQSAPGFLVQSLLTKDTSMDIATAGLVDEGGYLFDVTPVNAHDVCLKYSAPKAFTFTNKYGNVGIVPGAGTEGQIRAYPNPVGIGQDLQLSLQSLPTGTYSMSLISMSGQEIATQDFYHSGGNNNCTISTRNCSPGIYFLRWKGPGSQAALRIMIGL